MARSFYDAFADRLQERFGFKRRDAKLIAQEVFKTLHHVIAQSDEVRVPYIGKFRVITSRRENMRRWSYMRKQFIEGPMVRWWLTFKACAALRKDMKIRKFGAIKNDPDAIIYD